MKFADMEKIIEGLLADKDNYLIGNENGLVYGDPQDIESMGVCWSPNIETIAQAAKQGVDMLLIHEPLTFEQNRCTCIMLKESAEDSKVPNIKRKTMLDESGMAVYRVHSNLDVAKQGTSWKLASLYKANITDTIEYGLVGTIEERSLRELIQQTMDCLNCENIRYVGNLDNRISRAAFVAGGGARYQEIVDQCLSSDAQLLVSGDLVENTAIYASEAGLDIIDAGHYCSENEGIRHFCSILKSSLPTIKITFFDSKPKMRYWIQK